jgi:putative copper resistance protein D
LELSGWDTAAVCAEAVTYAATLGAAGAIFFLRYGTDLLQEQQHRRIRRLIGISLGVAALASCAKILLSSASMSGELAGMFDRDFARMILGAGEGHATGVRIAGLALGALIFSSRSGLRVLAQLGAVLASISFVFVGHIHALLPNPVPALLLCVHLLCAAFWLGALAPLLIAARDGADSQIAALASRFGVLALGIVMLLLCAGLSLLWILIDDVGRFWSSDYGKMIVVKLLLVTCLLGLAAVNKLRLTPRLLSARAGAVVQFKRTVRAEMVFGALILLVTAALTTVTGPPQ